MQKHSNEIKSLYKREKQQKKNGQPYKRQKIKRTSAGNLFTHSLDFLVKELGSSTKEPPKELPEEVCKNIKALCEIRDSAVHFYNSSSDFQVKLQEIGSASVHNFMLIAQKWFDVNFDKYNFYLMPLAFVSNKGDSTAVVFNREEGNVIKFLESLGSNLDTNSDYQVSLSVNVNFLKSKTESGIDVRSSNDPDATKIQYAEKQFIARYPLEYRDLCKKCKERYSDFKPNKKFHNIRQQLENDNEYCYVRFLNPNKKKSSKKWYSNAIFNVLDKHYMRIKP